ncbi:hypothetical protein HJFPF1_02457 [Paramyrothecium foliicola]|nr:hypothetical protein HJFPF1_02457 [Paramyrothecium foliicola]
MLIAAEHNVPTANPAIAREMKKRTTQSGVTADAHMRLHRERQMNAPQACILGLMRSAREPAMTTEMPLAI